MKKRILSGAQPSGQLHIGNYFGMIERMIQFQNESDLFCFVANYANLFFFRLRGAWTEGPPRGRMLFRAFATSTSQSISDHASTTHR